jgi:hypothetical protein
MMTAATIAPPQTIRWVAGLTRADQLGLIDSLDAHALRAALRHCLQYAPDVTERAITERIAIRAAAKARLADAEASAAEQLRAERTRRPA